MARDFLAIPLSTVPSESAFSLGGRILGESRSSLTPEMLEALVCGKNWMFKEKEVDNEGRVIICISFIYHCCLIFLSSKGDTNICIADEDLCEDQPINPSTMVIPSGTAQHTRSR